MNAPGLITTPPLKAPTAFGTQKPRKGLFLVSRPGPSSGVRRSAIKIAFYDAPSPPRHPDEGRDGGVKARYYYSGN